ncbi:MAG: fatty acid desaturase [Granulosicoccus sp.]
MASLTPSRSGKRTDLDPPYPPLEEVRKTLRIKWYRSPISHERLLQLSTRTDSQGWKQAGGHVGLYLVLASLTIALWWKEAWLGFFVSMWCLGFVATFFKGTAAHELGHGTVFRSRALNRWFLHGVCLISWWDPYDYGASHTYHHRFTTHREADRENVLPLSPSLNPWLLLQLCTLNLFTRPNRNFNKGGFCWTIYLTARSALGIPSGHTDIPAQEWLEKLHADQPEAFRQSVIWSRTLIVFHLFILIISAASGWWALSAVITLPSYVANIGSFLLGTTQHCGLMESNPDFRKNTRSIVLNPFMRFLYWHMNWHTEHHMFAGVPCYNLKALAQEIHADMPEPRTLFGAWKEMRETWRIQQLDPDYAFDTPVPAKNDSTTEQPHDPMASSIGDLAPKGSALT